jgi:hypothetical protein
MTSIAKLGVFEIAPPALVGTLNSIMVIRENTALMSRKGISTTIRFKNEVIFNSGVSTIRFL